MLSRRLASAVVLGASLCMAALGVNVANAAPSAAGTSLQTAAGADMSLMKDCFVYKGSKRGCSSFSPVYEPYIAQFEVCDSADPGGKRYTIGRISVTDPRGRQVGGLGIQIEAESSWERCSGGQPVPIERGDRVCIHTGVEGLGWTTAECRTF